MQRIDPLLLNAAYISERFVGVHTWEPEFSSESLFTDRVPVAASVLIPIVLRDRPTVLLTERSLHLSSHSGQIAFPGGKADGADIDVIATALRETYEEVGLSSECFQVLGVLPTYSTGSGYVVSPVVAFMRPDFTIKANAFEVADVFEVPLEYLMDPANHRRHAVNWGGVNREWLSMVYQNNEKERFIWGATAGMLRNLYQFLS
jgi:8-oxo-dGTP pyrophosphatase MutT (NUDIX family)